MTCRFRKLEPSLSSMKEKSLESRRVRTQPCTDIGAIGAVRFNASFIRVGESMTANWTSRRAHSSAGDAFQRGNLSEWLIWRDTRRRVPKFGRRRRGALHLMADKRNPTSRGD